MSCHGGPTTLRAINGEYGIWLESDPHARAYTSLLDERSQGIEKKFRPDSHMRAEADTLCLSCHVHQEIKSSLHDPGFDFTEGVSCEACHGPSGDWLGLHTTRPWKSLSPDQKSLYGMVPTEDLASRAQACAACHVGTADAEVNHDLIAAGHPRLNFEFASYNAIYPKHWDGRLEKARMPDLEARAWLIGQLSTASSALDLLSARAARAHAGAEDAPWPEFSEYACYSCHHDLGGSPARKDTTPGVAAIPWGTWYFSALPGSEDHPALADLRTAMAGGVPPADEVARLAASAASDLRRSAAIESTRPISPLRIETEASELSSDADFGWDEAAQRFLGLAALANAASDLGRGARPEYLGDLGRIRSILNFPAAFDSPRSYNSEEIIPLFRSLRPHRPQHPGE